MMQAQIKTALIEALQEKRKVFAGIVFEVIEDIALVKAIEEGKNTETVSIASICKLISEAS